MPPPLAMKMGLTPNCGVCGEKVYLMEQVLAMGQSFHKKCFKCSNCKKLLEATSYAEHEGKLMCKACKNKMPRSNSVNVGIRPGHIQVQSSNSVQNGVASPAIPAGVVLRRDSARKAAPPPPVETVETVEPRPKATPRQPEMPKIKTTAPLLVRSNTTPIKVADTTDSKFGSTNSSFVPVSHYKKADTSFNSTSEKSSVRAESVTSNLSQNESSAYHFVDQNAISSKSSASVSTSSKSSTPIANTPIKNSAFSPTGVTVQKVKQDLFEPRETPKPPPKGFERPVSLSEFIKTNVKKIKSDSESESESDPEIVPPPPAMFSSPVENKDAESNFKMKHADVSFTKDEETKAYGENQKEFANFNREPKGRWQLEQTLDQSNIRLKSADKSFDKTSDEEAENDAVDKEESNTRMKYKDVNFNKAEDVTTAGEAKSFEVKKLNEGIKKIGKRSDKDVNFEKTEDVTAAGEANSFEVKKLNVGIKSVGKRIDKTSTQKAGSDNEESNVKLKHVDVSFEKTEITSAGANKETLEIHVPGSVGVVKIIHNGKEHIIAL